jgi:hypothetical protein
VSFVVFVIFVVPNLHWRMYPNCYVINFVWRLAKAVAFRLSNWIVECFRTTRNLERPESRGLLGTVSAPCQLPGVVLQTP